MGAAVSVLLALIATIDFLSIIFVTERGLNRNTIIKKTFWKEGFLWISFFGFFFLLFTRAARVTPMRVLFVSNAFDVNAVLKFNWPCVLLLLVNI